MAEPEKVPPHDLMLHAHGHEGNDLAIEPHEHLHSGPGHMGVRHSHRHRHAPDAQMAAYVCPLCSTPSASPADAANGYCGRCGSADGLLPKDPPR